MVTPEQALTHIPKELETADWQLALNQTDLQVYYKTFVDNKNPIIGFKTVSQHPVTLAPVVELLKDVCEAMHQMNDLFLKGEQLEEWPSSLDEAGSLVRTSFKMPFPLANREFLHGLHQHQLHPTTHIVAYTPVQRTDIPTQKQHVRCEMAISGQRISYLENGTVQVEHLMVYHLGGAISSFLQDYFFKKAHIGAYAKEWRGLRTTLYPAPLQQLDYQQLSLMALHTLQVSAQWPSIGNPKVGKVKVGRLGYSPKNAFRTDVNIPSSIEQVVKVMADQSLNFLPQWNKEFIRGTVLETLEGSPQKAAWIIQVHYQTPPPLANREYIYYFSREWLNEEEVLIIYNSIQHSSTPPKGFVRGLLYPTVHYVKKIEAQQTLLQHVLVTDLKGKLSKFQDSLLKGSLAQAHCRDMENQLALFESL